MGVIAEVQGDLFNDPYVRGLAIPKIHVVQCISADYVTGNGFAADIESKYHIRTALKIYGRGVYPDCLVCQNIINMVTKSVYNSKPTYKTFENALELVRLYCQQNNIAQLIMPRIGSRMDMLDWETCKSLIIKQLVDHNIDIRVYYI